MKIIKINKQLYCITETGRFRKNWKNAFRAKKIGYGTCEACGEEAKLTADHHPPLREQLGGGIKKICWRCHEDKNRNEQLEANRKDKPINQFIIKCCEGHYNYLIEDAIVCKECETVRELKKTGEDEYETAISV